jgi:hypothetical protein
MAVAAALLFSLAVAAAMSVGLDRLLPKDQLFVPYFTTWHAVAVPENTRDFFQGERALSTHIIESRPAGYSKEQVGDPRRRFALPVLLTGAFLPVLDFNVVSLAPAGHSRRSRRKFERSAVRHLGLCRDLRGVSDHGGGLGDLFGGGGRFSGGSPDSQSPLCCAVSHGHLASWSAGESFKGLRRRC